MKIAMFTDAYWPRINGVTVAVDTFSKALVRLGHEVMIICSQYPEAGTPRKISSKMNLSEVNRIKVLRVPSHGLFFSHEDRMAKPYRSIWVQQEVHKFDPDIIHIHSEFIMFNFGSTYAQLFRKPLVYTFHTLWEDYIPSYSHVMPHLPLFLPFLAIRIIRKFIFAQADIITAPTAKMVELLHKKWKVKQDVELLPTGIESALFKHSKVEVNVFRDVFDSLFPEVKDKKILLFSGRIAQEKNINFLLSIAPDIVQKHPEAVFVFAGNGPDYYYFQSKTENMQDYIIWTDYLDRETISLLYAASSIFLFPSLTETQGLVTIEAMMSGLPVVAIAAEGTINVMGPPIAGKDKDERPSGFLVDNNQEAFKKRVCQLLEDETLYREKSEGALAYSQNWDIAPLAQRLVQIYQKAEKTMRKIFFKENP
ncbi:MAG: glycosyltransferase [Spirochaetaceae bacterium]|jgi:glycosyltransferase involved in cell wall biosynthesis|nr:glycosyltransferase [Spirochaetaceae bacterium]